MGCERNSTISVTGQSFQSLYAAFHKVSYLCKGWIYPLKWIWETFLLYFTVHWQSCSLLCEILSGYSWSHITFTQNSIFAVYFALEYLQLSFEQWANWNRNCLNWNSKNSKWVLVYLFAYCCMPNIENAQFVWCMLMYAVGSLSSLSKLISCKKSCSHCSLYVKCKIDESNRLHCWKAL